jgi:hypothetical protein
MASNATLLVRVQATYAISRKHLRNGDANFPAIASLLALLVLSSAFDQRSTLRDYPAPSLV